MLDQKPEPTFDWTDTCNDNAWTSWTQGKQDPSYERPPWEHNIYCAIWKFTVGNSEKCSSTSDFLENWQQSIPKAYTHFWKVFKYQKFIFHLSMLGSWLKGSHLGNSVILTFSKNWPQNFCTIDVRFKSVRIFCTTCYCLKNYTVFPNLQYCNKLFWGLEWNKSFCCSDNYGQEFCNESSWFFLNYVSSYILRLMKT